VGGNLPGRKIDGRARQLGTLIDQVFLRRLCTGRLIPAASVVSRAACRAGGLKPISFIIPDIAKLRSLAVQSTLVRVKAKFLRHCGSRLHSGRLLDYVAAWVPIIRNDCWAHVAARALLVIHPLPFAVGYLWAPEAKLLSLPISRRPSMSDCTGSIVPAFVAHDR
jgi:hypothetical protein